MNKPVGFLLERVSLLEQISAAVPPFIDVNISWEHHDRLWWRHRGPKFRITTISSDSLVSSCHPHWYLEWSLRWGRWRGWRHVGTATKLAQQWGTLDTHLLVPRGPRWTWGWVDHFARRKGISSFGDIIVRLAKHHVYINANPGFIHPAGWKIYMFKHGDDSGPNAGGLSLLIAPGWPFNKCLELWEGHQQSK